MEEPPLFAELLEQAGALFLRERVGQLQALDGDELAEADVDAAVDDPEPAVPHDRRDAVLALDRRAAELERIQRGLCLGHCAGLLARRGRGGNHAGSSVAPEDVIRRAPAAKSARPRRSCYRPAP